MTATLPPLTEAAFMRQVVELAALCGWKTYHPFLSKWSQKGWPDLSMVRRDRLVFAELKSERGKVTPEQQTWIDALNGVYCVEAYVWRPSDFDEIARVLR